MAEPKWCNMLTTKSNDGTTIAYEKIGSGSNLILVTGALAHRTADGVVSLASELSKNFTVFYYDRRGRGDSTDTKPYNVKKEIQDIEALVNEAGGSAFLFGSSSGGALTLLAGENLGSKKIMKIAVYEPPFGSDTSDNKQQYAKTKSTVKHLVENGKTGDAVSVFFESIGLTPEELKGIKESPVWKDMERVGHTLVYDYEVLGDGTIPVNIIKKVDVPTQIIVGEKSFDFMHTTADALTKIIAGASQTTLKGQSHQASPKVLAPVLVEFFNQQ